MPVIKRGLKYIKGKVHAGVLENDIINLPDAPVSALLLCTFI